MAADLHGRNVEAESGGDEAGGISTGPATVGLVGHVELEPGGGELAEAGQGDAANTASTATLGVGVDGDDAVAGGGEGELDGLVAGEETVDATIGTNLVPAGTLLGLRARVLKGDNVVVLGGDAGVDNHHVAAVVALDTDVALVGNLGESSTLGLLSTAEGGGNTATRAGSLGGGRGGRAGGDSVGVGSDGSHGSRSSSGRGGDDLGDGDGLVGDDKVTGEVVSDTVEVSMATGVGRHAEGGGQEDSGRGELHCCGCCELLMLVKRLFIVVIETRQVVFPEYTKNCLGPERRVVGWFKRVRSARLGKLRWVKECR